MDDTTKLLESCELCPRRCKVNRLKGQKGYCAVGAETLLAYYGAHFGEEPPVSGVRGSGNVFFSSCNVGCIYCQNYQISHQRLGKAVTPGELVKIFFHLREQGAHNINLVSPTPYVPFLVDAIREAKHQDIGIPFVYNTHAYENVETLTYLEGLIDIYLPDFKYWSGGIAKRLSNAPDYPEVAKASIREMKRQVGDLRIVDDIAQRGILIRHLVLPANLAGSKQILTWIRDYLGPRTFVSLMAQYYPLHDARAYPLLNRKIRQEEYGELVDFLSDNGFENVFLQELESALLFVPDFNRNEPFGV